MKKLTVSIPDSLDDELRNHITEKYEDAKGAISIVVTQALREYLERETP